jgi:hypothetical protein
MPNDDPQTSSASRNAASSRVWLVALLVLVASMVATGIVVTRSDSGSAPPASAGSLPSVEATTTTTTTLSIRSEVTSRLREIILTRDKALLSRDASLLNGIYTIDCPCLKDGRTLIDRLRKENIVWKGVRTNITIYEYGGG